MNTRAPGFYADLFALIVTIVIALAFIVFPIVSAPDLLGLGGVIDATAFSLLFGSVVSTIAAVVSNTSVLYLIPVGGLVALVSSIVPLFNPKQSRIFAFVTAAAGLLVAAGCVLFVMDVNSSLLTGGGLLINFTIGLWLMLIGGVLLMLQVLVPRSAPVGGEGVVAAEMNYIIPQTGAPQQSAPRSQAPKRRTVNAWLVEEGSDKQHQLFEDQTRIGRSRKENDIALSGDKISREHALVRETNGKFVLYDRASTHGIMVNGQMIRGPKELEHGDIISLGDTRLQFVKPN